MTDINERTELLSRASKAIVEDRGPQIGFGSRKTTNDFQINPDFDTGRVLEMVRNDPVVRGAITTIIDKTLEPGYSFYGKDRKSRQQAAITKMEELRFDRLLRGVLTHLFTYNNAFIEIVGANGKVKELYTIDPNTVDIYINKNGEVQYYSQSTPEGPVIWTADEIVHLKSSPMANRVWGDIEMRSLWTAVALKYHIKKLFLWRFETNQERPLLNIKNANDEQIKRFLSFLDEARSDIKKLVPIEGEVESIFLTQEVDYVKIKEFMAYLDYEILNLLQVPPISVGLPDSSNRSNSDAQERTLNTRVKSIQRLLEDVISNDLLTRIGFTKVFLKFNTVDIKTMKDVLEMAERMRNMGIKEDVIKTFMEDMGWDLPEGKIFDENAMVQKSNDMFPSRKGKAEGETSKNVGTGQESTTREDQLVSRGFRTDLWTYDVEVE